jgi:hypothetical protein
VLADAAPAPDAAADAVPPDAGALLPLFATGADLGLAEAGVAATGFVRFDNNSGADIVLDTALHGRRLDLHRHDSRSGLVPRRRTGHPDRDRTTAGTTIDSPTVSPRAGT